MIKIRKLTLVLLVIVAVICGGTGMYALTSSGILTLAGGGRLISGSEYDKYVKFMNDYGKADELKNYILSSYYIEPEEEDLMNGMYKGLFAALGDPYSYYMTPEEYENEQIQLTGDYSGIGATLTSGDSGYVEVVSLTKNSPAEASGLRKGDAIVSVDGVEFTADQLSECASSIRGKDGSVVQLHVLRDGEAMDFSITRAHIVNESVESRMLSEDMGYIAVTGFETNTAKDFEKALKEIEDKGASSLVIDLRDNPGGLVNASNDIANLLMEKGTLVYVEDQKGNREYYKTNAGRTKLKYAVLVNEGSASASEILVAGIQDNNEGEIVGVKTFGKGIIQDVQPLRDGSGIKLTFLQYFSPSGKAIHKVGITPDYIVELTDDCYSEDGELIKDLQLEKAIELLKSGN